MLGMIKAEKSKNSDMNNNTKIVEAYQSAYEQYCEAQDRYESLLRAYNVLKGFSSGEGGEEQKKSLPNTEKIMKRMIEDAAEEQALIADFARDCVKHLRTIGCEA